MEKELQFCIDKVKAYVADPDNYTDDSLISTDIAVTGGISVGIDSRGCIEYVECDTGDRQTDKSLEAYLYQNIPDQENEVYRTLDEWRKHSMDLVETELMLRHM